MVIKNNDGTVFKLQGINPLMKGQDRWEKSAWTVSYLPNEIILKDPKRITPEGYLEEDAVPAISGVVVPQTEVIYCKPLFNKIEEDPVYGTKKILPMWGDKYSFEAIKTACNGITAIFFTRLPSDNISKLGRGSILYVFKEREWWKVQNTEPSEGDGFNIHCVLSDLKPSFV
jgi:hypothetical protein